MAKRVEYQELIDLDGFRTVITEARADYAQFVQEATRLNASLKQSMTGIEAEMRKIRDASRQTNSQETTQLDYLQRLNALIPALQNQRTATAALTAQQQQLDKVNTSLFQRQEQLLTQYASITGHTARDVAQKKRLASELVTIQTQYERLAKSSKLAAEGAKQVDGQYNRLQQELVMARAQLKGLSGAFDENTGKLNKNNAEAVRLARIIQTNDTMLRKFDQSLHLHTRNLGNYPKNADGMITTLASMATGYLTLDAAFGAVAHVTTATAKLEDYETALTQALGSQKAALESLDMIRQFGDKNKAINVDELTQGFVKLTQRGFVPTREELTRLVDLALSTNKSLDQLAEGILDAQTGEFERLKEFGITAAKAGDQITFSFKGQATTVKATGAEIQKYILSLGDIKGVAGSAAAASAKLTGTLSDFGNVSESIIQRVGKRIAPLITLLVSSASAALRGLANLLKSSSELAGDSLSVYEDQRTAVKRLNEDIAPLLDRYDELSQKARQVGGETNLSRKEQNELRQAIDKVASTIPSAISAQNEYGRVMSINTGLARDYITEQERVAQVLNAESINKYNDALKLTQQRTRDLTQQLTQLQGATPTPGGSPAVSSPSNSNQSSGFKPGGLTEAQRASEIARIRSELEKANEEAKSLSATIDYLSGKAPKPKTAIPASKPSTTLIGSGGKDAQKAVDERLKAAIDLARREAEVTATALDAAFESGAIREVDYLNQRLTVLQDGILKEQELLQKAGKETTDEYIDTQRRLNDVAADYLSKRNKLDEESFKRVIDSVKNLIESDTAGLKTQLAQRVADLQVAYNEQETGIKQQVASRQVSESESERRLYELKLQLLRDIAAATADNSVAIQRVSAERLSKLEADLRAAGKTELAIQQALEDERKKMLAERTEAERKAADDRVKISETEAAKKQRLAEQEKDIRQRAEETYWQTAVAATNGYFELTSAFRQQDLDRLERDKARELELAGDNEQAKANIAAKYDAKSRELRRKQAIADKAQAAFNVVLSTTESIMKTFAQFGFVVGTPLAIAMGALGAVQLGVILSKPIPEFWRGTTDAPEGPAWVGERGYELIESKKGGKSTYRLAAQKQLTYLNKHDKVYTHAETKRMIQVNQQLAHETMSAPGGSLYVPTVNSGPSKIELIDAFKAAIAELPVHEHHNDERGQRIYERKQQQHTEWLNSHFSLPKKKS